MRVNRPSSTSPGLDAARRLDRLSWKPLHTRITLALDIGWLLGALAMLPWCLRGVEGRRQPLEALTGEVTR